MMALICCRHVCPPPGHENLDRAKTWPLLKAKRLQSVELAITVSQNLHFTYFRSGFKFVGCMRARRSPFGAMWRAMPWLSSCVSCRVVRHETCPDDQQNNIQALIASRQHLHTGCCNESKALSVRSTSAAAGMFTATPQVRVHASFR